MAWRSRGLMWILLVTFGAHGAPYGDENDTDIVGCIVRTGDDEVGCTPGVLASQRAMRTVKRITNPSDGNDTGFVGCNDH